MRRLEVTCVLGLLLCVGIAGAVRGEERPAFPSSDEQLLRQARMATDTESLLAYLRTLTRKETTERVVQDLVRELGAGEFAQREQAAKRLVGLGRLALPVLRQNEGNADPEIARRVGDCIREIDRLPWLNLPLIVVRLLVQRKAEGAVPLLLAYLGQTTDPDVEEEIYYGLDELAVREGRVHPALAEALTDPQPASRAVAGCILGRVGDGKQKEAVRGLLKDADARVRLRAAQGLLTARENAAVPALIGLLDEPAVEIAWQAEELLHWIAGETAPEAVVGAASAEEHRRCQAAWRRWWGEQKEKADWDTAERDCRGPGLVLSWNWLSDGSKQIRFRLCGCEGTARFSFDMKVGEYAERDGRVWWTGRGLILPVQGSDFRLREESLAGATLWESVPLALSNPPSWQRLGDGRTLVADGRIILELDSQGKQTSMRKLLPCDKSKLPRPAEQLTVTQRVERMNRPIFPGPETAWFMREGRLVGEWVSSDFVQYIVEYDTGTGEGVAVAESPRGDITDLKYQLRRVAMGWCDAIRLRNGHTVYAIARISQHDWAPIELDRVGRKIWEGPQPKPNCGVEVIAPLVRFGFHHRTETKPGLDTQRARLRLIKSHDPLTRLRAARWLHAAPPDKEIGMAFLDLLRDGNPEIRQLAVEAVSQARKHVDNAMPKIAECLDDNKEDVWRRAVGELARGGPEVIPLLIAPAQNEKKSVEVRARAVAALTGHLKDPHPGVLPTVRKALRENPSELRQELLWYLRNGSERGVEVLLPDLLAILHDPDSEVAWTAGVVIAELGKKADQAVPELLRALNDRRSRAAASSVLGQIRPGDARVAGALIQHLGDRKDQLGFRVIVATLAKYGPDAAGAVPTIVAILDDPTVDRGFPDRPCRSFAIHTLECIGKDAKPAVPKLLAIVRDKTERRTIRKNVVKALQAIDPEAGKTAVEMMGDDWTNPIRD